MFDWVVNVPLKRLILIKSVKHLVVLLLNDHLHRHKANSAGKYNIKTCYKYPLLTNMWYQPRRLKNNLSFIISSNLLYRSKAWGKKNFKIQTAF